MFSYELEDDGWKWVKEWIRAHRQSCPGTLEVGSRRGKLRAILDGLDDDDRQWIKGWIEARRLDRLDHWQWIKGWIEAHRRSCP
jgi:hypothetical protein